jgi:hypothetical protein
VNQEKPWADPKYLSGLERLFTGFIPAPWIHPLPPESDPFEWARGELRRGRPILAALPKEIWQALPSGFLASRPWNGGDVGHQIVINGFTWNNETKTGSFHVINSWNELPDFDLSLDAAKNGVVVMEASLSPKGEVKPSTEKEIVKSVTLVRSAGKSNLYDVETNLGRRRIAASSEEAARALVEQAP